MISSVQLNTELQKLSDPTCKTGFFNFFFTTNEAGTEHTRIKLSAKPLRAKSCHIGFSGFYNFDIMVTRRSEWGLICDFNPLNKSYIEKAIEILKTAPTRAAFIEKMVSLNNNALADEVEREGSWLNSVDSFAWIKNLALQDRIVAINLNITNTDRCQKIAKLLQDNAIAIDTLYVSNIGSYMFETEEKKAFVASVHALLTPDTSLINCPIDIKPPLRQRVYSGADFQTPDNDGRLFVVPDEYVQEVNKELA